MSFHIYNFDPIILVVADGTDTNLSLVTSVNFSYTTAGGIIHEITIPSSSFLVQTSTVIRFTIPDHCDFEVSLVNVTITSTQFSGSVQLGPNTVLIANGSGIYKIIPNKTSDTVYVSSNEINVTADVKIPDPFGKLGFIGG